MAPPDMLPDTPVTTLFVCTTCRREGETLPDGVSRHGALLANAISQAAYDDRSTNVKIVAVECLSNCTAGCTVAITAAGKWTYVVGRLDPEKDARDVLTFATQHSERPDGVPAWRDRPLIGRKNVVARIPPLPTHHLEPAE